MKPKQFEIVTTMILESVIESGKNGLISGTLYAVLCGYVSFDEYQTIISTLKRVGLVTENNHVLKSTKKFTASASI